MATIAAQVVEEPGAAWMAGRRELVRWACEGLTIAPGGLVLDVASGDGELSALVCGLTGGRLITNDFGNRESRESYKAGRAALRGDVLHLPIADAAADLTIAFEIVEHFPEWQARALIDELWRVTKPGGYLLLSTPNRYSLRSLKGLLSYLRNGTVWNALDQTHVVIYSPRALRQLLERRFRVLRTAGYYLVPEVAGRSSRWTYVQTQNPVLQQMTHKLMVVARRRG